MAVCGRCLICGHKFDGDDTPDVGVRWECKCDTDTCASSRETMLRAWNEVKTHAICTPCVAALADGTLDRAAADLVALLARRRDD